MTVTERPRATDKLDLDAEQEVDFRRYWNAVLKRWWLPALGLLLGVLGGYALALSGGDVYRAESTLYLGQPFTPNGATPVPGLATNPSTVNEIVHSEAALQRASEVSGMRIGRLRANVISRQAGLPAGRRLASGQTPLIEIAVTGANARATARAANALAEIVVEDVSPYVEDKIAAIQERIDSDERELAESQRRLDLAQAELNQLLSNQSNLNATDRLVGVTTLNAQIGSLVERRGLANQDLLEAKQALSLAENVEQPSIVERAAARKTTARSVGRSLLVGGLIGLILGILAAIFWEPVRRRFA
jgi:capsular polysaccharide biosynthesis protein